MNKIIKIGDRAPSIQSIDLWGNPIHVPTQDKWVYLSFHRFAACPFCNLRTNELIMNYESFEKQKIEVVSIWPSSVENLLRHAGKDKTPFPMLSDENKTIYGDYGVVKSSFFGVLKLFLYPRLISKALKHKHKKIVIDADPKLLPASFLIDPAGIIKMVHYGTHIGDHPSIKTILQLTM